MSVAGEIDNKRARHLDFYLNGHWQRPQTGQFQPVLIPATGDVLGWVPRAAAEAAGCAVTVASQAFPEWRSTPPQDRIHYLFTRTKRS